MDINTIIGALLAFVIIFVAMAAGPGGVMIFVDIPSLAIVFGGTTGVTLLAFTTTDLRPVMKVMLVAAFRKQPKPTEEIERVVEFANLARKEGLLALEGQLQNVSDPFLSKGIQLVIDGFSADTVRDIMELEAEWEKQRHEVGRKIMDQMAAFCPAFGMIGTLVGLVQMLQDLSDPSAIGIGMATALLTTLYGAMGANMYFIPMAGKLEMICKQNVLLRALMVEGIVAIQSGEKPQLIKEKLKGFLAPATRATIEA